MLIHARISDSKGQEIKMLSGYSKLTLHQVMDDHHSFRISYAAGHLHLSKGNLTDWAKRLQGKQLTIELLDGQTVCNSFKGLVMSAGLCRRKNGHSELVISGFSTTMLLDVGQGCCSFTDQKLGEIADTVLRPFGNKIQTCVAPINDASPLPYSVRYQESVYRFLGRLATRHGQWYYFDGQKLVFGRRPAVEKRELVFGANLKQFNVSLHTLPLYPKRLSYNYENNETYEWVAQSNLQLSELGKSALEASESIFSEEDELTEAMHQISQQKTKIHTEQLRQSTGSQLVKVTGVSRLASLHPGAETTITNCTGYEENDEENFASLIVTCVTHLLEASGNYENQFEATPTPVPVQPRYPDAECPKANVQLATITDNNDPKSMGRVKVRFPWQGAETTPWLRCSAPYAGANHGICFTGEVGSQAKIDFESGDPERPWVTAVVWHGKALPPQPADNNDLKIIRTRSGNEIRFFDKEGEAEIKIGQEGINELILSVKENGAITIRSKGDLNFEGQNISLVAKQNFSIRSSQFDADSSGEMALKGTMIKLNS